MKLPLFAALLAASLACAPAADAKLSKAEAAMARTVAAEQDRSVALLERLVNQNTGSLTLAGEEQVGAMMHAELEPLRAPVKWTLHRTRLGKGTRCDRMDKHCVRRNL